MNPVCRIQRSSAMVVPTSLRTRQLGLKTSGWMVNIYKEINMERSSHMILILCIVGMIPFDSHRAIPIPNSGKWRGRKRFRDWGEPWAKYGCYFLEVMLHLYLDTTIPGSLANICVFIPRIAAYWNTHLVTYLVFFSLQLEQLRNLEHAQHQQDGVPFSNQWFLRFHINFFFACPFLVGNVRIVYTWKIILW